MCGCVIRGVGDILCMELEFYSASMEQFKTRGERNEAKLEAKPPHHTGGLFWSGVFGMSLRSHWAQSHWACGTSFHTPCFSWNEKVALECFVKLCCVM